MAFDLTIGTEPAKALQDSIQDELQKKGFSPDADPVMAEYITIMLINNKTAEQITAELEDLIGANEYDPSFTEWLFTEAAKKSQAPVEAAAPAPAPSKAEEQPAAAQETGRKAPTGPRAGSNQIYNQALNQALPSSSSSGHKRTASARSPSPVSGQPNKTRRLDLPTGPRAMHGRDGVQRTLLDRMSGRQQGGPRHGRDEIQARIDAVTNQGMNGMNGVNGGGFNNGMGGGVMMPGNDMAAAAAAMGGMMNPLALQEMMMNQMALMAQMANSIGLLGNQNQFPGPNGFPVNNGANVPFQDGQQQQQQQQNQQQHRRGGAPGGRGGGKGPGKAQWVAPHIAETNKAQTTQPSSALTPPTPAIVAPTATPASVATQMETAPSGLTPPARPQSPSLCKFGLKCTNALCRYSHPSPVATPESGVVLSNDHCEAGLECKDKDCVKAHVSPAAVGITSVPIKHKPETTQPSTLKPPCRYGTNCTKAPLGTCPFSHPFVPSSSSSTFKSHAHAPSYAQATQCRFGAGCTRATCPFQHPPGRVLPGTFHRGLEDNAPTVKVRAPMTGTMGASPHKSVVFNKPGATGGAGAGPSVSEEKTEQKEGGNAVVEAAA